MTSKRLRPWHSKQLALLFSPWSILILFAGLGLIGTLNHVMWRDEFNTWLIVRDSQSLGEMLGRVKYQGHTALWALCVSFLRNFSQSPVIMQLFHWAVTVVAMTVFWVYSPFKRRYKVLFIFGYLPFYEYFLIARPYALGMLFLFVFCAIFPYRSKRYIPAAILLALMANSNAYSLFISMALLLMLAIEFMVDPQQRSHALSNPYDLVVSLLIIAASYGFSVYILIPPGDSYNHGGLDAWNLTLDVRHALHAWGRVFAAYTLIEPSYKKWADLIGCGLITLFIVLVFMLKLVKKPLAFVFFGLAYLEILAFTYFRFIGGGPRHFGQFYLVLIAAFWLAGSLPESDALANRLSLSPKLLKMGQQWCQPLLTAILIFQFLGGLYGLPKDLLIPFSASRETANYIREAGWQDAFIVASRDANMASIAGYLDRKLYYPETRELGSFTLYGGERQDMSHEAVLGQVKDLLMPPNSMNELLLLLHKPLQAKAKALTIEPIREFKRSWVDTERYYLYRVTLS
jgi:hypothetical protein